MCTVTYIPTESGFYLTSSRDEISSRPTIAPDKYCVKGQVLVYPKDGVAGGTWISVSNRGRAACLLNGAFEGHNKEISYKKSRGVVLLDSLDSQNALEFANDVDLDGIEPFTLLLLDFGCGSLEAFYELKWDGKDKHLREVRTDLPQIWSSPTLYPVDVRSQRQLLFENWLNNFKESDDKRIFDFHNQRHGLESFNDIVMHREGELKTLSISQINLNIGQVCFNYFDIVKQKKVSHLLVNEVKFYA